MKAKEFIIEVNSSETLKPRNFVAKHAHKTTSGAGAHKDKKRAEKQGDVKHKKQAIPMEGVAEGWGDVEFKVGDWAYSAYEEDEGDVRKMYHSATGPDGKRYDIDFSPYAVMDKETFKMWVKLGMPKRKDLGLNGPVEKEHIMKMAQAKGVATLDREMARAGMQDESWDDWGSLSKRDFKRRELEYELGHETNNVAIEINGKIWKIIRGEAEMPRRALARGEKIAATIKRNAVAKGRKEPEVKVYVTGAEADE